MPMPRRFCEGLHAVTRYVGGEATFRDPVDAACDTGRAALLAQGIDAVITGLIRRSTRIVPDDVPCLVADQLTQAGMADVSILLADIEQRVLLPVGSAAIGPQEIDTTLAGRAFKTEQVMVVATDHDGAVVWVPLVDGSERLGVLHLRTPATSDELLRRLEDVAGAVSELVVTKTKYGDALVMARRTQTMTLAAELRWSLLPPLTFTGDHVGIACELEPAYEMAGDCFDYAINDGVLHLAVMDAMGHGLEACQLANLATAAYRSARRRGLDLPSTYRLMDDSLRDQFGDEHFVTAQLATLDVRDGTLRWINAGHPHPLLLRQGRASELQSEPALPLGLGDVTPDAVQASLEPADALLFFTDGIVEAGSPGGERFGAERLLDLTRRALADKQSLAETVRRLVRAVRAHRDGPLADDATMVCVGWHPPR